MNLQQAHKHPDLPDYCTVCDPPRHWSEWLETVAEAVVLLFVGLSILLAILFAGGAR